MISATSAITAIAATEITPAPVIVRDVLPVLPALPVLSTAVLPANPVQTDSLLPTSDSNVMNRNVQSVSTFPSVGGVTNDVVVSNLAARYLLPHEKVRRLSKVPTYLEVLSITNDLRKNCCPYTFLDVVPLDVEQSLAILLQRQYCAERAIRDECGEWKSWTTERFCKELLKAVPDESIDTPLGQASFL